MCETKKDVPPSPILHLESFDEEELGASIYKSIITARKRQDEEISQQKSAAFLDRPVDISKSDDKNESKYEYESNHRDNMRVNGSFFTRRLDKQDHKVRAQFAAWQRYYYKKEHGDCLVAPQPSRVPANFDLMLENDCITAASSPEVSPHVPNDKTTKKSQAQKWNERFCELEAFKSHHGHCNVPQKSKHYCILGAWLSHQREVMRKLDIMQGDQKQKLGTGKEIKTAPWDHQFTSLLKYRQLYGNCDVPTACTEYRSLGRWVSTQRSRFREFRCCNRQLSPEGVEQQRRFQKLTEVGFRFAIGKRAIANANPLNNLYGS
ncbi:hypothetical protein ACHAXR_007293 [Thalassiosira sp. AJA248-18]